MAGGPFAKTETCQFLSRAAARSNPPQPGDCFAAAIQKLLIAPSSYIGLTPVIEDVGQASPRGSAERSAADAARNALAAGCLSAAWRRWQRPNRRPPAAPHPPSPLAGGIEGGSGRALTGQPWHSSPPRAWSPRAVIAPEPSPTLRAETLGAKPDLRQIINASPRGGSW